LTVCYNMIGLQSFLSGGFAGMLARTLTSPLDVVKILNQVGTPEGRGGFLRSFLHIYRAEGLGAFFKGNMIACLRLFPYNAIQFTAYNEIRSHVSPRNRYAPVDFIAGASAGIIATVITYPLDMMKTRMTTNHVHKGRAHYKGLLDAVKTIARQEGTLALYKGLWTSMLGVIPYAGGTFMAYGFINSAWGRPPSEVTVGEHFIGGCLAAAFAQTFSYPFDTLRKKIQASSATLPMSMRPDIELTGLWDALRKTVRLHGVVGLYAGTTANLVKIVPYSGAMFAVFEFCKRISLWYNGYSQSPTEEIPKPGVDQTLNPSQLKQWYIDHGSTSEPRNTDTKAMMRRYQEVEEDGANKRLKQKTKPD
jgi:solute carrier family 25 protein 43